MCQEMSAVVVQPVTTIRFNQSDFQLKRARFQQKQSVDVTAQTEIEVSTYSLLVKERFASKPSLCGCAEVSLPAYQYAKDKPPAVEVYTPEVRLITNVFSDGVLKNTEQKDW